MGEERVSPFCKGRFYQLFHLLLIKNGVQISSNTDFFGGSVVIHKEVKKLPGTTNGMVCLKKIIGPKRNS